MLVISLNYEYIFKKKLKTRSEFYYYSKFECNENIVVFEKTILRETRLIIFRNLKIIKMKRKNRKSTYSTNTFR